MSRIHYQSKTYSYEEVKRENFPSEQHALKFCSEWLNQKQIFIVNTSGSTGSPKPIEISRIQMIKSAAMTIEALGLYRSKKSLVCLNPEFIAGKMMLVRSLEMKMDITIVSPSSNPIKDFSNDTQFDFAAFVPLQLETIIRDTPDKIKIFDNMKAIIIGGAAISPYLEDKTQWIKAPVYHTFGMTETISHIALRRLNGIDKSDYFQVLKDVSISLDSRGCLTINSPFNDKINTNDIVEIKSNEYFKWIGRVDNVINSGGIKIHPEKIETSINKIFFNLNLNNRFFIAGLPHPQLGETVCLIIEGKNNWDENLLKKIDKELANSLSKYEVPKKIYFQDKFKETLTGKIDKSNTLIDIKETD